MSGPFALVPSWDFERRPFAIGKRAFGLTLTVALHVLALLMIWAKSASLTLESAPQESIIAIRLLPEVQLGKTQAAAESAPPVAPIHPPVKKPEPVVEVVKESVRPPPPPPKKIVTQVQDKPKDSERAAASPAPVDRAEAVPENKPESLLDRLRANWLEPPRSTKEFRCKLKITYRSHGVVTAVAVDDACNDRMLADSIERAVWKTQPLPLSKTDPAEGNIELEFSP